MRIWAAVLLFACLSCKGCKGGKDKAPPPPVKIADASIAGDLGDAGGDETDWRVRCEQALTAKLAPVRKLGGIVENCRPCGDWHVLLAWNKPVEDGGPPEAKIEEAMTACRAFCTPNAKQQFLGVLPDSRGKTSNKPWRTLGEQCKEAVSAVPDVRFMSAPYFALDRIARATGADPKLAPLAAAVEIPLPAVSITGIGFDLPEAAVTKPELPKLHVTVIASELRIGRLATAKLTKDGVVVEQGTTPYPGELVTAKDLRAKLDALTGSPTERVMVIAATGVPAARIAVVAKAAGTHELVLAVAASGAPHGWTLPGIVPVVLDAKPSQAFEWKLDADVDKAIADLKAKPAEAFLAPRITIAPKATVADLAKLLGALAFRDAHSASLR